MYAKSGTNGNYLELNWRHYKRPMEKARCTISRQKQEGPSLSKLTQPSPVGERRHKGDCWSHGGRAHGGDGACVRRTVRWDVAPVGDAVGHRSANSDGRQSDATSRSLPLLHWDDTAKRCPSTGSKLRHREWYTDLLHDRVDPQSPLQSVRFLSVGRRCRHQRSNCGRASDNRLPFYHCRFLTTVVVELWHTALLRFRCDVKMAGFGRFLRGVRSFLNRNDH